MTRTYGYNETLQAMRLASEWFYPEAQAFGVSADGLAWNPYVERVEDGPHDNRYVLSPIGATFSYLGHNLRHLEQLSDDHCHYCEEMDCHICSEEGGYADTSLYSPWVTEYLSREWDIEFTEQALDLLWSAERSGLTLTEWYANRLDILAAN